MKNSRNNGLCYAQACAVTSLPDLGNDKAHTNLDSAIRTQQTWARAPDALSTPTVPLP